MLTLNRLYNLISNGVLKTYFSNSKVFENMEEELIEAVRSEKCLYDVKHPDYVKVKLKDAIWKRIAKGLNLRDGNEAKKSWEKLRNNHRDALRRQKKPKSASGTVNIKPWRFQENMAFLLPHMGNRFTNTTREEAQSDELQAQSDTRDSDTQENIIDDEDPQSDNDETNQSPEPVPTFDQARKRRRYKKINLINSPMNKFNEQRRAGPSRDQDRKRLVNTNDFTVNNVKNDPLFHFFMSMYETTKRLPPVSQHIIKTNVFSLVSREESKNLQLSPRAHSSTQIGESGPYYASYTLSPVQPLESFPEVPPAQMILPQENTELALKEESDSMFEYNTEAFN